MSLQRLEAALRPLLAVLYGPADAATALGGLLALVQGPHVIARSVPPLDHEDVWVIAYGDHVHEPAQGSPLVALGRLLAAELADVVDGVHVLPFHPSTSDDGFAVADHTSVDPAVGTWEDLSALGHGRRLMVDAVVNHVSAAHPWAKDWLAGERPGWIMEAGEGFDTSRVVRPRTSPLLTTLAAPDGGSRRAWTTFSADQLDLDHRTPAVLVAMTEVLLSYVDRGAQVIRLDAIGYLWKESGTSCIHLPQTHAVVRLWRTVLEHVAPGTMLITETNVPHEENVSYLGSGDEAHLVYRFPLAPLVLDAYAAGDTTHLREWAHAVLQPPSGTTFLNVLGTHDGVGLRPVEGLLPDARVQGLADLTEAAGGSVSLRARSGRPPVPYELNTTYVDALAAVADDDAVARRVAGAHAVLLALQGVPALWLGSLFGLSNDREGVRKTGMARSVNRGRIDLEDLRRRLQDPLSSTTVVHRAVTDLVRLRRAHPAFAPDSPQRVLPTPGWLFAVERGRPGRRVVVVVSVADADRRVTPVRLIGGGRWRDRLQARGVTVLSGDSRVVLPAYGLAWLEEIA